MLRDLRRTKLERAIKPCAQHLGLRRLDAAFAFLFASNSFGGDVGLVVA
jgi:hypothetical protein